MKANAIRDNEVVYRATQEDRQRKKVEVPAKLDRGRKERAHVVSSYQYLTLYDDP